MNVEKVMTKDVYFCRPDDAASIPAQLMWEHDVGAIPVVDAERRAVAMITDRDIAMGCLLNKASPEGLVVKNVMSKQLFYARPSQTIHAAEELMRSRQVRRLPVVDEAGVLIGIVTLGALAVASSRGYTGAEGGIEPDDVAVTLAEVSTHREAHA